MSDSKNIGVDLGKFWGEKFEFDKIFQIRPETRPVLGPGKPEIHNLHTHQYGCRFRVILGRRI
jgi:hypothetical protein